MLLDGEAEELGDRDADTDLDGEDEMDLLSLLDGEIDSEADGL